MSHCGLGGEERHEIGDGALGVPLGTALGVPLVRNTECVISRLSGRGCAAAGSAVLGSTAGNPDLAHEQFVGAQQRQRRPAGDDPGGQVGFGVQHVGGEGGEGAHGQQEVGQPGAAPAGPPVRQHRHGRGQHQAVHAERDDRGGRGVLAVVQRDAPHVPVGDEGRYRGDGDHGRDRGRADRAVRPPRPCVGIRTWSVVLR